MNYSASKMIVLWRELIENPYSLDIEALDVLLQRDAIEDRIKKGELSLSPIEKAALDALDEVLQREADSVRAELELCGAWSSIAEVRDRDDRWPFWWHLGDEHPPGGVSLPRVVGLDIRRHTK